ncbi:MAG: DNA cytosine methyltransferase [Desulfovibrionaceae bacterium]|nr:DNA cytosine methyltransferase [Desulfovibrionaceae bacterium]
MSSVFRDKIARLNQGHPPRVLDLFSGCGGISLGFTSVGFQLIGAIEFDPVAARSHAMNFFRGLTHDQIEHHARAYNIVETEPLQFISGLGFSDPVKSVDVIVGGPPCQAFARVGRAKLREVAAHPHAFIKDPRHNLYLRYLQYVRELRPLAILMENVPDVLNHGGHNVPEEMCEVLDELGYASAYTLLNAVHYGVPQMRERAFLVAYANEITNTVRFPSPTHRHSLPKGYEGTRQVALKHLLLDGSDHFLETPRPEPGLPKAVTARDALKDLPPITLHLKGKLKKGPRRFDSLIPYDEVRSISGYGKLMREWLGYENYVGIYDHVIRYLPRDYAIFARMNPGDQYPEAYKHAQDLFREKVAALNSTGRSLLKDSAEYKRIWDSTVPPYDPGKFPNKWRKMEADQPARTLMAHLGKDSYSHIHYDSKQARTISVREAARLQSFPDGFIFCGPMNPGFRQIGNAVPPLLIKAIAAEIFNQLCK